VLEPPELALDGAPAAVQRPRPLRLAVEERVQPKGQEDEIDDDDSPYCHYIEGSVQRPAGA
jgi:hypothetical protein